MLDRARGLEGLRERLCGGFGREGVGGAASLRPSCRGLLFDVPRCRSPTTSSLWPLPLGQTCSLPRVSPIILPFLETLYQCQIASPSHIFSLRAVTRRPQSASVYSPPSSYPPSTCLRCPPSPPPHRLVVSSPTRARPHSSAPPSRFVYAKHSILPLRSIKLATTWRGSSALLYTTRLGNRPIVFGTRIRTPRWSLPPRAPRRDWQLPREVYHVPHPPPPTHPPPSFLRDGVHHSRTASRPRVNHHVLDIGIL